MSGKGDKRRPEDTKIFDLNYELIFMKPSEERKAEILKEIDRLKCKV